MKVEWPGRCSQCREEIGDWADSGYYQGHWVHKSCFSKNWQEAQARGVELAPLKSPEARSSSLELPMLIFLLMFHFGLGAAVAGWITIDQGAEQRGIIMLAVSIAVSVIGVIGVAINVMSRTRIQSIRQALELQGGWKPGR